MTTTTTTTTLDEVRRAALALRHARKDARGDFWPISDARGRLFHALRKAGCGDAHKCFSDRAVVVVRQALAWANEQEATR